MTGNIALDIAIGLVFVYTLYSLFTTTIVEFISTNLQLRARTLSDAIKRMLDDDGKVLFSQDFYNQPIIKYLGSGWLRIFNKPSYLQSRNFSKAVILLLAEKSVSELTKVDRIKETLIKLPNSETSRFLLSLLEEVNYDLEKFTASLEEWFDDTMERTTGWYKRRVQYITFIVGLFIATIFNVDTFQIVDELSKNPKVREQYVQMAGQFVNNSSMSIPAFDTTLRSRLLADTSIKNKFNSNKEFLNFVNDSTAKSVSQAQKLLLQRLDTVYSYTNKAQDVLSFKRKHSQCAFIYDNTTNFFGCLITAIALALGSPFWFELLSKLMKLRGSVRTSDTTLIGKKNKRTSNNDSSVVG